MDNITIDFNGKVAFPKLKSVKYTISVHAVHAGAERNVCNIVVSIHFKYILVGRQDMTLTSAAHLRKRLS